MIYLDHNATTPPWPAVVTATLEAMTQHWANASSQHEPGQQARRVLAAARATAARVLGCKRPAEKPVRSLAPIRRTEQQN